MSEKETKKKEKKVTDKEARELILNYMKTQNRPYNAKMVSENLKCVSQTQSKKILADLSQGENAPICVKLYGKVEIYWQNQSVFPEVDVNSVNEIEAQITTVRNELNDVQAESKQLASESAALGTALPIPEIERRTAALEKKTAAQDAKLTSLRGGSGAPQVSRATFLAAEQALQAALKAWRLRKKMAKEIVDDMAENSGTKPSELRAELCIDDDAAVGVDIAQFAKYDKPSGVKRGAGVGFSTQPKKT